MGVRTVITCDACGAERKETNHWFTAFTSSTLSRIWFFSMKTGEVPFHHDILCGEACCIEYLSKNLSRLHSRKEE